LLTDCKIEKYGKNREKTPKDKTDLLRKYGTDNSKVCGVAILGRKR